MNLPSIGTLFAVVLGFQTMAGRADAATVLNAPASPSTRQQSPLGNRLSVVLPPAFTIGDIVFSNAKFQNCTAPAGFLGVLQNGALQNWNWGDQFCWLANVNVNQTNHPADMAGKKIQLLATTIVVTGAQPLSVTSLYEAAFQSGNSVTLPFVIASGYIPRPLYPTSDPRYKPPTPDFLYSYFSRPYGVTLQVQYNGAVYATLRCTYFLSEMDNCHRQ